MRQVYRLFAAVLAAAVTAAMAPALYLQETLPDRFSISPGGESVLASQYPYIHWSSPPTTDTLSVYGSNSETLDSTSELRLLGLVKIKDVSLHPVQPKEVALCGTPFGIKMCTDGVIVVGTGSIPTENGPVNPAKRAGIVEGDRLLAINGHTALSNSLIAQLVRQSEGQALTVRYIREETEKTTVITPALSTADGQYHIGLWVRDSSAGIGTLTCCDPTTGEFIGLGHAICDVDTGQLMPISNGQVVKATINGSTPGTPGQPGELQGSILSSQPWGILTENRSSGVYGRLNSDWQNFPLIYTAHSSEVTTGPAQILCTISGTEPCYYDVEIERIHSIDDPEGRNLVLRITDPDLLKETGGILQGMSGSPIIQNGKLAAAVTHVFINDPSRGYGIFIENMLN